MHRMLILAFLAVSTLGFAQKASLAPSPAGTVNVVTRQNDNSHTAQNLQETILTPANVNSSSFGKIFSYTVDGQIYAEPLYVSNLTMAGGSVHNVVFVATEYDSVYAFDADSAASNPNPLWHTNFLNSAAGVTPVPCAKGAGICQLFPVVGITSTPVINLATNTLYVVARTQETSGTTVSWVVRLHALNITSGAEQSGSPATICSSNGTTRGCTLAGGTTIFGPQHQQSRPGLLLVPQAGFPQGVLVIGFAGDSGWVLAYDPVSLKFLAGFYTDDEKTHSIPVKVPGIPGAGHGGIWGAGGAIVADSNGNIYAISGDGYWDGLNNWGDSLVKLVLTLNSSTGTYTLVPADYFTTSDEACRYSYGKDYGSAGPLLLPPQGGATPNLIFTTGKQDSRCETTFAGYVINRDNMGHVGGQVSQMTLPLGGGEQSPAYFNTGTTQYVYNGGDSDALRAFTVSSAGVSTNPVLATTHVFDNGTSPSVSANGTSNGIVWGLEQTDSPDILPSIQPVVLHAFDATTLAELYNSAQAPLSRDKAGPAVKFQVPMVANGKVYVGTSTELDVYGLCPCGGQR
ncbi:MAG TPA: hypothetical protein VKQ11_18155 [Candidatus Sulfotelmatobacter sp.]|nr:hypothetical protein [Candidatus Sulfotelmatobacter sp.]